jgi:hypothetical protein
VTRKLSVSSRFSCAASDGNDVVKVAKRESKIKLKRLKSD